MDLEIKIKEEPAWLEGTGNASLENIEHVTQIITLKKEAKSELTEPGPTENCSFEPSEDTKEEIFIEQHTVGQLMPYIKEETNRCTAAKPDSFTSAAPSPSRQYATSKSQWKLFTTPLM
ncbi:uncharacterized protein [Anabrus simplex]|uniref:uncharacterized protein n=1 Tax=Anabrus simplex TaxID=316456 RepID=UPI0035A38427